MILILFMLEVGKQDKEVVMEYNIGHQVVFMKENGKMIKQMGMEE